MLRPSLRAKTIVASAVSLGVLLTPVSPALGALVDQALAGPDTSNTTVIAAPASGYVPLYPSQKYIVTALLQHGVTDQRALLGTSLYDLIEANQQLFRSMDMDYSGKPNLHIVDANGNTVEYTLQQQLPLPVEAVTKPALFADIYNTYCIPQKRREELLDAPDALYDILATTNQGKVSKTVIGNCTNDVALTNYSFIADTYGDVQDFKVTPKETGYTYIRIDQIDDQLKDFHILSDKKTQQYPLPGIWADDAGYLCTIYYDVSTHSMSTKRILHNHQFFILSDTQFTNSITSDTVHNLDTLVDQLLDPVQMKELFFLGTLPAVVKEYVGIRLADSDAAVTTSRVAKLIREGLDNIKSDIDTYIERPDIANAITTCMKSPEFMNAASFSIKDTTMHKVANLDSSGIDDLISFYLSDATPISDHVKSRIDTAYSVLDDSSLLRKFSLSVDSGQICSLFDDNPISEDQQKEIGKKMGAVYAVTNLLDLLRNGTMEFTTEREIVDKRVIWQITNQWPESEDDANISRPLPEEDTFIEVPVVKFSLDEQEHTFQYKDHVISSYTLPASQIVIKQSDSPTVYAALQQDRKNLDVDKFVQAYMALNNTPLDNATIEQQRDACLESINDAIAYVDSIETAREVVVTAVDIPLSGYPLVKLGVDGLDALASVPSCKSKAALNAKKSFVEKTSENLLSLSDDDRAMYVFNNPEEVNDFHSCVYNNELEAKAVDDAQCVEKALTGLVVKYALGHVLKTIGDPKRLLNTADGVLYRGAGYKLKYYSKLLERTFSIDPLGKVVNAAAKKGIDYAFDHQQPEHKPPIDHMREPVTPPAYETKPTQLYGSKPHETEIPAEQPNHDSPTAPTIHLEGKREVYFSECDGVAAVKQKENTCYTQSFFYDSETGRSCTPSDALKSIMENTEKEMMQKCVDGVEKELKEQQDTKQNSPHNNNQDSGNNSSSDDKGNGFNDHVDKGYQERFEHRDRSKDWSGPDPGELNTKDLA